MNRNALRRPGGSEAGASLGRGQLTVYYEFRQAFGGGRPGAQPADCPKGAAGIMGAD